MTNETRQNFEEKLRLVIKELLATLDNDYEAMLRMHAAKGLLRSGNTIKATMNLISCSDANFYSEVLDHIDTLKLQYNSTIESDIVQLTNNAQDSFKVKVIEKFTKSTEVTNSAKLFDRLLPDVETDLANNRAVFLNSLNAKIIDIKKTSKSSIEKILWVIEIIIVLTSIFIAGMWFKDPQGNYEPILVGLGLVIPLIYLGIRHSVKTVT